MLKVGSAGALGVTLAGCMGGDGGSEGQDTTTDDETDGGNETDTDTTTEESDPLNVGMVYALGGLGDNSFNDMAHQGVQDAADEFGIKFQNAEPGSPSEVSTLQTKFARDNDPNYDLICCIGFLQADSLGQNAQQFPDQKFMVVDTTVDAGNVASYVFKEQEGSFQVGHMAGLLTETDFSAGAGETNDDTVVGFVGGKENPLIKKFEAGYTAGVKHANEDIEVRTAYAGSWSDSAKGQEIALSMYNEGADIVYHAAGGTGTGVFKAAQEQGRFAIGVDADQSKSLAKYDDVILASMVKRVDEAVYRSIENVKNGEFAGGSNKTLGLEKDGVAAVYGNNIGSEIPDDVKSAVEDSRKAIIAGDISVPTDPDNV